jgi:uncharacterized Zn finger protein
MAWYGEFRPYVSVAERRRLAEREIAKRKKKGQVLSPVAIPGRKIAATFWGASWCDHLESYSDFASRLPRGRAYVRNGAVIDLRIEPGRATALVQGTELYEVTVTIAALPSARWSKVIGACAGKIDSLVELLQGKLSRAVMEVVTHRETGLFPAPTQISLRCSCPDAATMCKHVAAALYGVGARLDEKPELLFVLRKVDHLELIAGAGSATSSVVRKPGAKAEGRAARVIAEADISSVFGIELAPPPSMPPVVARKGERPRRPAKANETNSAGTAGKPSKTPATKRRVPPKSA